MFELKLKKLSIAISDFWFFEQLIICKILDILYFKVS